MSLFDAIESGDLRTVRKLIRTGADLEAIDESTGVTPLALAAECGHLSIVRVLLRAGVDPDWGGATTPLEAAALEGHNGVVQELIEASADVNRPVADGFTPLITAAANGDLELVRLLLDAGALVPIPDDEGHSALVRAKKEGHKTVAAELEARSSNGHGQPQGRTVFEALENRDPAQVRQWLEREADLGATNGRGLTPLARAAELGHLALIRQLLAAGADVQAGGQRTPLYCAAENRHSQAVKALLEAGARADEVNPGDGRTALMAASANGQLEIVLDLLEAGADPKIEDARRRNALWAAAEGVNEQAFAVLAQHFSPEQRAAAESELHGHVEQRTKTATQAAQLTDLIATGAVSQAKRILANGLVDPDGFDEEGRTALMIAAQGGHRDVVRMLINAGASFEVVDDGPGWTALIHAVRSPSPEAPQLVALLASSGADPNRASRDGLTPLMHAVEAWLEHGDAEVQGFEQLVEPLFQTGADLHARDGEGRTVAERIARRALSEDVGFEKRDSMFRVFRVFERLGARTSGRSLIELLIAVEEGELDDVDRLLSAESDPNALDGLPLLDLAARRGHWAIVNRLLATGIAVDTPGRGGRTLLMQAAEGGLQPIVEQLLAAGADATSTDDDGRTASELAAAAGHDDVAALLGGAKKRGRPRKAAAAA